MDRGRLLCLAVGRGISKGVLDGLSQKTGGGGEGDAGGAGEAHLPPDGRVPQSEPPQLRRNGGTGQNGLGGQSRAAPLRRQIEGGDQIEGGQEDAGLKAGGAEDVIGLLPQILPLLEQEKGGVLKDGQLLPGQMGRLLSRQGGGKGRQSRGLPVDQQQKPLVPQVLKGNLKMLSLIFANNSASWPL